MTSLDTLSACVSALREARDEGARADDPRVQGILASLGSLDLQPSPHALESRHGGPTILEAADVCRTYDTGVTSVRVLADVSLDVRAGELLVLVGESGCGKTTLLKILAGMLAPTSGSVRFMGLELVGASREELTQYRRCDTGFVFQGYSLMSDLTARQNVDLAGALVDEPLSADEALELVGLGGHGDRYPSELSGGQQQRVAIARALIKRPRIVFADEPTAALDHDTALGVLDVFEQMVDAGTAVVMVTHNEEICRMADRVLHMGGGRVLRSSEHATRVPASELVW